MLDRLEVDSKLLDMFWLPDLYFVNDKEATVHDVTMANRMLHIYRNGSIRTSSRSLTDTTATSSHSLSAPRALSTTRSQHHSFSPLALRHHSLSLALTTTRSHHHSFHSLSAPLVLTTRS